MVASAHDQDTLLLIQLSCQLLDLIIQTEDFFNQVYMSEKQILFHLLVDIILKEPQQ